MVTVYWKGGQSGSENDPDNRSNWVTTSGGSSIIDAADHTGLANGTTDVVIDYATSGTTHCEILTGTAKKNWKSLTIDYHASLSRILRINGTDINNKAVLTLRGMVIKNNASLFSSGFGQIKFTGVPLYTTDNSVNADLYIKIDSTDDSSLDTDDVGGMFFDGSSRKNLEFLFEPPASTTLTLQNGVYPNMDFDAGSNTATLSFESLADISKTNRYPCVSMLNLEVDDSFTVSPRTYNFSDKNKHVKVRGTLTLTCATFNMGLATFELIPVSAGIKFPVTGSPTYGVSNNFNATFSDVIIGTPTNQTSYVEIEDNTVLSCEHLHIKAGGRLYGPIYGSDNSAEIHTTKAVTLDGDWNFSQKATGVYRTTGTQHRLNVSSGGTGLNTVPVNALLYGANRGALGTLAIGSTGEVLAVKSDGTLEWSATAGGGGVTVQEEGVSLATTANILNFTGNGVVASGTGATKTITITDTDTNTNQLTTFDIGVDTNTNATTISHGETLTFTGGTGISTETTADGTVTITTSLAATQVAYGSSTNTITGESDFTYDATNDLLAVDKIKSHTIIEVQNATASSISKGQAVYIETDGTHPSVAPALATDAAKMPSIGLAQQSIPTNGVSYICVNGSITVADSIIDDTLSDPGDVGKILYVSETTAGNLTITKPTSPNDLVQNVGKIADISGSNVKIIVTNLGRSNDVPNTISIEGDITTTTGDLAVSAGQASFTKDVDGEFTALTLTNQSDAADTTGKVSVLFNLEDTSGNAVDSAKILVEKKQSFTPTASTQDSRIRFYTSLNGTITEGMSLAGTSLDVEGGLEVKGGSIDLTNGSYITSASAGTLLLNEDIVKTSGNLLVGGNDIKASDGTTAISLSGNDVTIAGDLTVNGDSVTVNTATLSVEDPLIILASGNNGADSVDIGFYGLYDTSGSQDLYAGLFRDANDSGKFKLFKDLQVAPTTTVNVSGTGYAVGTLVANIEGNVTGNATTATTATNANQLNATNDRDLAPEDLSYANDFQAFFTSKEGLEDGSTSGGNYQDAIVLNTWSDSTGGDANLLAFDKSEMKIYHYQADQAATNWGTAKQLAYTDSDITGNAATTTLASDNGTESHFLTFSDAATGSQALKTDDTLTYIPSSGRLTTNVFVGELAGNVTGNVTGDLTGNADTVTNGVYTTGDQSIAGVKTFTSIPLLKAGLDLVNPNLTGAMGITLQNNDGKFLLYTDEGQLIIKDFLVDTGASTDGTDTFPFKLQSGAATDTFVIKTGGRVDVSGALYAGSFVGDVTGNVSGTAATVTGATQSAITTVGNAFTITGNDSASLNITAIDNGASPAQTTFINMTGYDDRGQGIRFFDTNSSGEEWFAGIRYSGGFDEYTIGYDASGGQSEYVANALLQVNKNGNVTASTFVGALTGNADTVTNGVYTSGNQTIGGIKTLSSYMVLTGDTTAAPVDLTSVHLGEDGGQLEVRTQYGTIQLGGVNSSYNHIEGSAGRFYFNKPVVINGNGTYGTLSSYSTEDLILTTNNGTETRMTIKQDTGNVGIGTTSPVSLLHLKKNAYNFVDGTQDEDGDFHLMIKSDEASSVGKAVSIGFAQSNDATTVGAKISHVIEGSYSQGSLVFSTNSTASAGDTTAERMRITSAGNVGIGTTSPTAKLQVVQPDASWTILAGADVNAQSLTDNTRKFMRLGMPHYDTDEQSFSLITGDSDNGVNRLYLGGGTGIGNAATQIYFRTSANSTTTTGTTRMTVASDGKVGIGTESPSSELEVAGNTSGNVQITIDNDNTAGLGTYALQEDGATTGIFQYRGSTNGTLPNTVRVGSNVAGGSLAFTYADGTTGMYMQGSDGKVGIGTTAPAVNLHVSHATDPKIRVQDSSHNYSATLSGYSGGAYLGLGDMDNGESEWMLFGAFSNINNLNTRTRDFHLYGTNTTKGFYFDESAGRFGIGTTTPEDGILEVVAPLDPSGSDTTFTYATTLKLDVEDSDSAEGPAILFRHGATGDHNAADYYFQVNGDGGGMSAHEYANNWGYAKWFHGAGADGYKPLMKISYGGSTNAGAAMYGTLQLTSATAAWDVFDGTHTGLNPTSFTTGVYLNAGGNSYINGGNLGIGTTSPSTKLHLSDSAEVALSVDSSNSIGSTISLDATATGGDEWRLISAADGAGTTDGTGAFGLYNMDVSAYRLVVEGTTGHVGIGTATPSEMLHVESADEVLGLFKSTDAGAGIKIDTPDDGYAVVFFSEAGTNKWSLGKLASNSDKFSIYDEVNTTPRLVIDTSGNVGIGTTSPTYKLHVVGSFTATTKEFTIPHPSKKGMTLSHGSLEGPEHGVYIRGKSKDKVFYLPDYWKDLVHEDSITVQLTPIGKSENLYVVDYNTEYIEVENDVEYFYYVQAERKDVDKLEVEF